MFFLVLRPIFCEKLKIAPPIEKQPPLKCLNLRNWTKIFFFWDHLNLGGKKLWISAEKLLSILVNIFFIFVFYFGDHLNLGEKKLWNHSQFWWRPFFFFFWRSPEFGRKKALNFRAFREISSQFSAKPSETASTSITFQSRSFAHFSLFQNSPPPFPNPGYAPGRNA